MTYEISIETVDSGIVGIDGDDKYGMDKFVENDHSTSASSTDVWTENKDNNDVSGFGTNETAKPKAIV